MIKKILIFAILIFITEYLLCQSNYKIGHINSQELIDAMPESDSASAKFEKMVKEYQKLYESMESELNEKYQEYITNKNSYAPLVRKTKEEELQDLNYRVQLFQATAKEELEKKQNELYTPVLGKAKRMINEVASENNFTYILDLSEGFVLYYDATKSIDILPLVKQKMGLK